MQHQRNIMNTKVIVVFIIYIFSASLLYADSLGVKLTDLKNAYMQGLISKTEYEENRKTILSNFSSKKNQPSIFNGAWRYSEAIPGDAKKRLINGTDSWSDFIEVVDTITDTDKTYFNINVENDKLKISTEKTPMGYEYKQLSKQRAMDEFEQGRRSETLPISQFQISDNRLTFIVTWNLDEVSRIEESYELVANNTNELIGTKTKTLSNVLFGKWQSDLPITSSIMLVRRIK